MCRQFHHETNNKARVLLAHNFYIQQGGEECVLQAERELLTTAGHEVVTFYRDSREIVDYNILQELALGIEAIWSLDTRKSLRALIRKTRPHVAHFHNTVPLLSPSAYQACHDAGIPVVQTLHNYRLMCPSGTLHRNGALCTECLGKKFASPAVKHGCYRNSRSTSAAMAVVQWAHRNVLSSFDMVDRYVVPSAIAQRLLIAEGLPPEKVEVKPHFVAADPGSRVGTGEYALFLGRLSPEKGISTLLRAWRHIGRNVPLCIVGDGPMRPQCESAPGNICCTGLLDGKQKWNYIRRARFVVIPSECYETFSLAVIEAFACGVPVIVSRGGSPAELVDDGRVGLHFDMGDADGLAEKVQWGWSHPDEMEKMGREGRREYEAKYTASRNYAVLSDIYATAIREMSA
jgi:glycosyltransferase involved in cell wall biosynthesis